MKPYKIFVGLLAVVLLFGLVTVANADDPPKPANDLPEPTSTPPPKGSFEPVAIHADEAVLDLSTASVTHMELGEDGKSLAPAAPPAEASPPAKGSFAPGPIMLGHFDGKTFQIIPDSANTANDLLIGSPTPRDSANHEINAASSTQIKSENFEGAFPNVWTQVDNNGPTGGQHFWGDVSCFPVESGGSWSGWPARYGANGVNPCSGNNYPDNVDSWLIYGPFSLADANSASLDFYFRIESEGCCDFLFWGASTNGTNFYGDSVAGTYTSGPFNNGYNFASLDLTNLAGEPQVWVAFQFFSNSSNNARGPFIDEVTLRKNTDARTYLTDENFDVMEFPNQSWESFDNDGPTNGDYRWDDMPCFARSGYWSMWPAAGGANGLNPCSPSLAAYPNNAQSWLIHGPFSLVGASEAWVDFHFRNQSEAGWDPLWWGVSTDGSSFWGFSVSGTYSGGPYGNGYNLMRFNLSNVPNLGDLRGQSTVWLAFVFMSDGSNTAQGPFIDDVSVVVEASPSQAPANQIFLPIVLKAPAAPLTNLYIQNSTTGTASYTVFSTPQGNITCSNIASQSTVFCGTFTSGTYRVSVSTTQCGPKSGEVNFAPGNVTRVVRCQHS